MFRSQSFSLYSGIRASHGPNVVHALCLTGWVSTLLLVYVRTKCPRHTFSSSRSHAPVQEHKKKTKYDHGSKQTQRTYSMYVWQVSHASERISLFVVRYVLQSQPRCLLLPSHWKEKNSELSIYYPVHPPCFVVLLPLLVRDATFVLETGCSSRAKKERERKIEKTRIQSIIMLHHHQK